MTAWRAADCDDVVLELRIVWVDISQAGRDLLAGVTVATVLGGALLPSISLDAARGSLGEVGLPASSFRGERRCQDRFWMEKVDAVGSLQRLVPRSRRTFRIGSGPLVGDTCRPSGRDVADEGNEKLSGSSPWPAALPTELGTAGDECRR